MVSALSGQASPKLGVSAQIKQSQLQLTVKVASSDAYNGYELAGLGYEFTEDSVTLTLIYSARLQVIPKAR